VQARLADALRSRRAVPLAAPAGYGKAAPLAREMARPGSRQVRRGSATIGNPHRTGLR
jgi:hypothetical protein